MFGLIIVYYHQKPQLEAFLKSLSKNKVSQFKLFIADLTQSLALEQNLAFPVEIIKGENKGYSYGVNICLRQALKENIDQFVVLNYDTLLDKHFIARVEERFKKAKCFGGKIYYAPGFEYHKKRYQKKDLGKVLWYAGGQVDWQHATTTHLGVDEIDHGQFDELTNTGFIPGTLFAFTREVVEKVGFWDERFFLYYEDTDYSIRAKKKGFKLIYDPSIIIWHKNAGTTGGPGSKLHETHQARSRLWFGLKHAPWRTKAHLLINSLRVRPWAFFAFIIFSLLFFGQRFFPLVNHNLAYTYDQGRDFLKAAEIANTKNLTFIGPTTGIVGLYHGAWWYYLLSFVYLIFRGEPLGFYLSNLLISFIALIGVVIFAYFEFGLLIMLIAGLIVSTAPYFIYTSLFVGNNIMAATSFLAFIICLYYLIKKGGKSSLWLLSLNGLLLGLVAEFELSFGFFLIPSFLLAVISFPQLRQAFTHSKRFLSFILGLTLAFLPRILFELKNGFSQTKVIVNFFLQPTSHHAKSYLNVLTERFWLFLDYYKGLFGYEWLAWLIGVLVIFSLTISVGKRKITPFISINIFLFLAIFFLSTLYRNNFFWSNYLEGIQYLILVIVLLLLSNLSSNKLGRWLLVCLGALLLAVNLHKIVTIKTKPSLDGINKQEKVVDYLYKTADRNFCVDIYTPPAIPYTYRYLFLHHSKTHQQNLPSDSWQNNRCWYILEHDDYADRKADWIESRIPLNAKLIKNKRIADIDIQLWQK